MENTNKPEKKIGLKELKALAYDLLVNIQQLQTDLARVNSQIANFEFEDKKK